MTFTYRNVVQRPLTYSEIDENFQEVEDIYTETLNARDVSVMNAGIYSSTADGISATSDGDYFSVPSSSSNGYLDLYQNDDGSAVLIDTYPNKSAVDAILADALVSGDNVSELVNDAGYIAASGSTILDATLVEYTETTAPASTTLSNSSGSIMVYTMTANTTFTDGLSNGQSLTLHLNGGDVYTPTWPAGVKTKNGSLPTSLSGTDDVFQLWKVGGNLYIAFSGSYS